VCLLVLLRGLTRDHPILVASNRDEQRSRPSAPPGQFVGSRRRMLSPRDRRAGGTWLAVGEQGLFAGLTNIAGPPRQDGFMSRGELPHLACDEADLDAAAAAVAARVGAARFAGFQLVLADAARTLVLRHDGTGLQRIDCGPVLVVTNEHAPGQLVLPDLAAALAPGGGAPEILDRLAPLLLDRGARSGHPILKDGADYGTVSSSLLAVPAGGAAPLIWRFAAGPPDRVAYRDYGNLARRLRA
jgi:hypothetical protein